MPSQTLEYSSHLYGTTGKAEFITDIKASEYFLADFRPTEYGGDVRQAEYFGRIENSASGAG